MSESSGTDITISEAADLAPAALAAAGADLHQTATEQISRHADRVENELATLIAENRQLRADHAALAAELASARNPEPPAVVIVEVEPVIEAPTDTVEETALEGEPVTELDATGAPDTAPEPTPPPEESSTSKANRPRRRGLYGKR